MIAYCVECKDDTEFDEVHEDRFNPGSYHGHYTVAVGMACLECGTELEVEEIEP